MLLEPLVKLANENIIGAQCLVKINKGKAVLRLINPNDSDIYLKGNKVLAIVSQVSDLDEQQKQELLQFLERNNDLFSSGLHDLGKTNLQTHIIDTVDAPQSRCLSISKHQK